MKVSDRTAKRRLLQLAELLESDTVAEHFNFESWGECSSDVDPKQDILANPASCGTTACALGWAPSLPFARKLGFELRNNRSYTGFALFFHKGHEVRPNFVAKALFGLKPNAANMLFQPGMTKPTRLNANATPFQVAKNIRDFVAIRFG